MWMYDNCTFARLKGKSLQEIMQHARSIQKTSSCGMLCPATLIRNERDFRRIGKAVNDDKDFEENMQKWKEEIEKDPMAMDLIAKGWISK